MTCWRNALAVALLLLWAVSAHLASTGVGPIDLHIAVAVTPLAFSALLLAFQMPWPGLAASLVAGVSGLVLAVAWPWLRGHVTWLYYLQHLGAHLALAAWFARSLGAGREPVVSAMARMIATGPLSARTRRYTRNVTLAWALFLAGNALVSTLLFAWAPAEVWSVHANLLTGPLLGVFFLLEMLVRQRVLPPEDRPSIKDVARAWQAQRGRSPASDRVA
ncbi:hypothetical protein [Pulveribacter sp.]|uniref:COG4648 family protein n=1 Tax=Pulveribacter sp. TaxID=2678893 RepID=UPI0028A5D393|nr:hypothetical protein [Pulveribacter sp.]